MTRDTFKEKGVPVGVPVDVVREYLDARACYEEATRPPNSHARAPVLKHDDPDAQRLREARVALDNGIALAQQPAAVDEAMVFRLAAWMAKHGGHDDPHLLIWEGSPPEPWGEVWQRYEDDARAALTAALELQQGGES